MSDPIPFDKNSYVAFDGTSIRDIIVSRLNQGKVFTDQNYQGSNLSALIDIVGITFNTLLYYLNKTSSESMFTEAQLYENMNRIVKLINYKPVGRLGQNVPFSLSTTSSLPTGNYFIPRYSSLNVGGVFFSTNKDIAFSKISSGAYVINDSNNNYLLYQGLFQEYPTYTSGGIDNETIYLALGGSTYIDHFNIFVYVKPKNATTWTQWENVSDLFLYKATDNVFTSRFNQNQNYELQFGDGINGSKLNEGDQVAIYYLKIDQNASGIAPNALAGSKVSLYNTVRYNQILADTSLNQSGQISNQQLGYISFNNSYPSNSYSDFESVDSIRKNAPEGFRSQYRLVTVSDYDSFIRSNFSNIITDISVIGNDDYLTGHIKYLYQIGLNNPQLQNQILIGQVKFANSCNFNNVYIYAVPNNPNQQYLSPSQKALIIDGTQATKSMTANVVVIDPVYMNLDFYVKSNNITPSISDLASSELRIIKHPNSRRASSAIASDVKNIIISFFANKTSKLGQLIDIYALTSNVLNIDGVQNVLTYRLDDGTSVNGISLLIWNSLYPSQDISVHTHNLPLGYFQYPIFNNISSIDSRINVVEPSGSITSSNF